jgi:hypothetical protein
MFVAGSRVLLAAEIRFDLFAYVTSHLSSVVFMINFLP